MSEISVLADNWNKKRTSTPVVQKSGAPIKSFQDSRAQPVDQDSNEATQAIQSSKCVSTIQVLIRTRLSSTISGISCLAIDPRNSAVTVRFPHTSARKVGCISTEVFRFEGGVLDERITQEDFFAEVGDKSVSKVWDGYNVTFFAYGQTGSGKTHTMYGPGSLIGPAGSVERGFVVRVLECLFSLRLKESAEGKLSKFTLSFIDIYDERVYDLMDPGNEKKVRESSNSVYVEGAVWRPLLSVEQSLALCEDALKNRRIAETKMNMRSSRSHTLCMIKVCRDLDQVSTGISSVRSTTAVITLVDLCGSERVKKSDAEGARLREAININSSLSALKSVITALGDGAAHIPYRESKLTWLLKDSIGINGMVYIVAHLNPHEDHHVETTSTLRFVSFARTVRSQALKNEHIKSAEEVLSESLHEKPLPSAEDVEQAAAVTADQGTQTSPAKRACQEELVASPPRYHSEPARFRCAQAFVLTIRGPDLR